MKQTIVLASLFWLLCSHELFLKAHTYQLEANEDTELFLYNGTFDGNDEKLDNSQLTAAKVIGTAYDFSPDKAAYYEEEGITYLKFQTGEAGTYVAGISTSFEQVERSAEDFDNYLEQNGLQETVGNRQAKGLMEKGATEVAHKYVKALLQVGDKHTAHHALSLGHSLEFVALENPYEKKVGDQLTLQLLSNGKPLAMQAIQHSFRNAKTSIVLENTVQTDKNGLLQVPIEANGQWYLSTILMTESETEKVDYESSWATLTFEIAAP